MVRDALRVVEDPIPDHPGLAYEVWAPVGADGKVPDGCKAAWLSAVASRSVATGYAAAYGRWKASFRPPRDRTCELVLVSRLLVGHGNASATDVGLTLHRAWGVPVVPGSALKGLLAHYIEAVYGPEDPSLEPEAQPAGLERERTRYRGPIWDGPRVVRGPGDFHRGLFGAPEVRTIAEGQDPEPGSAGEVTFHDALYVPGSAAGDRPLAPDVLTVHQPAYYNARGAKNAWPNDYDAPNPVAFLTVRPGARLLFALSGPPDWTELAERLLADALGLWGVGGKTSAGYGRFAAVPAVAEARRQTQVPRHRTGTRITVTRVEDPAGKGRVQFRADDGVLGVFARENPPGTPIGETVDVWVANVSPGVYTLTLREPVQTKKGPPKGRTGR